jgi:predicted nucleic acid-binding protein
VIAFPQVCAVVVDASLFVQLFVEELATAAITEYLSEQHKMDRFLAPSILASEAAAAITKRLRRKEIDVRSAREAFASLQQTLIEGAFELLPANDYIDQAFELSVKLHHPLHDCLYLAVAKAHAALFATRDDVLAAKARRIGLETDLVGADN